MKYIEVIADQVSAHTIAAIAEKAKAVDFRRGAIGEDGMQQMRLLVEDDHLQLALDTLQNVLGAQVTSRIIVLPVETVLPQVEEEKTKKDKKDSASIARERLYTEVAQGARLDSNYFLLVILSTIVVTIGLIKNNSAVVIGGMVIAPLLGPNLALSLGTALGDIALIRKSLLTLGIGILLSVFLAALFNVLFSPSLESHELLSRTEVRLDAVLLALASGAAGAISLTMGAAGALVGVMVAVALLPPAVTLGILLGDGQIGLAMSAGLLLAVNVVCVNLAIKVVFLIKRISPRTWLEKENAKKAMTFYILAWIIMLLILLFLIYTHSASSLTF